MVSKILAVVIPMSLLACGPPGSAAQGGAGRRAAKPLDVAGIRIGMSASDAEGAMTRGGWTWRRYGGNTWRQTIDAIVARQRGGFLPYDGKGVGGWTAEKGGEALEVSMRPTADGGRVEKVTYRAPIGGRSSAEFRSGLSARYGPPTAATAQTYQDGAVWCSPGDGGCAGLRAVPKEPYLTATYGDGSGGRVGLFLLEGAAAAERWTRERDAAVKAASAGAASF